MPLFPGGMLFEQKVISVANNDTDINNEITAQATLGWVAWQFIINGANMTIVFTRSIVAT